MGGRFVAHEGHKRCGQNRIPRDEVGDRFTVDSETGDGLLAQRDGRVGKKLKTPLYRLLGLDPERLPLTSFTIGIDTLDHMLEKVSPPTQRPAINGNITFS